jgi:hypothetical protein
MGKITFLRLKARGFDHPERDAKSGLLFTTAPISAVNVGYKAVIEPNSFFIFFLL